MPDSSPRRCSPVKKSPSSCSCLPDHSNQGFANLAISYWIFLSYHAELLSFPVGNSGSNPAPVDEPEFFWGSNEFSDSTNACLFCGVRLQSDTPGAAMTGM